MSHDDSRHPHHPYMAECAAEAARIARGVTADQLDRPSWNTVPRARPSPRS